ncbi:MAG: hypothetical protein ABMA15_14125 [Vicinamibacterales bacterium]
MRRLLIACAAIVTALPLLAQPQEPAPPGGGAVGAIGQGVRRPPPPTTPTPRLPDGSVDLSGLWVGGGSEQNLEQQGGLQPGDIPVLPWVKEMMAKLDPTADPSSYCLPMGVPRIAPYPWRFVQYPTAGKAATHLYILNEGNIHTYRQIFMDGRKHPEDLEGTWFGHSIGWWEKDTLVIDSVGFNGRVWMDRRGFPQTEKMHIVERYTRVNMGNITREVTIDDPGAYSKPFTVKFAARLSNPGDEIMEYICNENNQYGGAGGFGDPAAKPQ